jgi:hypothetical protein
MTPEVATGKCKTGRPGTKASETGINTKRESLELVRAYFKVRNNRMRQHILGLIQALSVSSLSIAPRKSRTIDTPIFSRP